MKCELQRQFYCISTVLCLVGFGLSVRDFARPIQQFVKAYASKAKIKKKVHPHLFRHNFATGVLENGGDIYDTQILLGHSSPTTTANVYAHLSPKYIASIKSPIANFSFAFKMPDSRANKASH